MKPDVERLLAPSSRGLAGGMICAVWSALVLLYAADYIFMRIPILGALATLGTRPAAPPRLPLRLLSDYGFPIWCAMAALSVLSLVLAFRNPGRRGWVAFNVYVLIASAGLAFIARQAAFGPSL